MKTDQLLDLYEQALEENLRDWFKEKWVRFGPDGKIRGDCARGDDSEGKPKCLPQKKAHALGKKGRASAARRKRREDPNPERRGKAINVATKKKANEGVAEGEVIPFGRRPAPALRWQDVPPDVLALANEWFWADDESMSLDAVMDPQGLGNGLENEMKYIKAKLQQRGWTIDHNDEGDAPGEFNLILTNRQGQSVLLPVEDAQSFRGWAQGTNPMQEAQLDELKCWDGYRRVPGKAPGSPGSCTRATAESMDGVSQGTHMFTSEENAPTRKGHVASFGRGGRVGILNKERILKAASFVTKQANDPQNEARLYVLDASSPNGIREVTVLDTAATKTVAQFIKNFFQNPQLNGSHGWLYSFLSNPANVKELAKQLARDTRYTAMVKNVNDPAHIKMLKSAIDQIGQISEAKQYGPVNKDEMIRRFVASGRTAAQGAAAWERIYGSQATTTPKPRTVKKPQTQATDWMSRWERERDEKENLEEKWSEKYKRSINCSNPKGFSQRAHCQGRKKGK